MEEAADTTVKIADRDPNPVELYARTIGSKARQAVDASRLVITLGNRIASFSKDMITSGRAAELGMELLSKGGEAKSEGGEGGKDMAGRKPLTRFDHPVSAHRVVDAVGFSLADCKKIRQNVPEVTINDIFMAACGGALRAYLDAKGELPKKSLNAMVPMTTRGDVKDADAGNQVGMTAMPLRSDIADPIERLLAVRRGSGKSKALTAALGKELPGQLIQVLPAMASKLLIKQRPHVAGQRHRLQRARAGHSALHGRRAPGAVPADLHRLRQPGIEYHRLQLPRHAVGVLHLMPQDDARPWLLRRMPDQELRRTGAGGGCSRSRDGCASRCTENAGRFAAQAGHGEKGAAQGEVQADGKAETDRRLGNLEMSGTRPPTDERLVRRFKGPDRAALCAVQQHRHQLRRWHPGRWQLNVLAPEPRPPAKGRRNTLELPGHGAALGRPTARHGAFHQVPGFIPSDAKVAAAFLRSAARAPSSASLW